MAGYGCFAQDRLRPKADNPWACRNVAIECDRLGWTRRRFVRHDAIVVGGSFAGLSAALYIARARRSVCILDTGLPRNRFAEHSHGFFGQDGSAPRAMLGTARSQVANYP